MWWGQDLAEPLALTIRASKMSQTSAFYSWTLWTLTCTEQVWWRARHRFCVSSLYLQLAHGEWMKEQEKHQVAAPAFPGGKCDLFCVQRGAQLLLGQAPAQAGWTFPRAQHPSTSWPSWASPVSPSFPRVTAYKALSGQERFKGGRTSINTIGSYHRRHSGGLGSAKPLPLAGISNKKTGRSGGMSSARQEQDRSMEWESLLLQKGKEHQPHRPVSEAWWSGPRVMLLLWS